MKTKFDQNYSSAVSSILFLENNELLVGAMWEGIVYYGQIESGLDNGIFVEGQFFFLKFLTTQKINETNVFRFKQFWCRDSSV